MSEQTPLELAFEVTTFLYLEAELLVSLRTLGLVQAVRRAIVFGVVLTAILAVLAEGYEPHWHPSAG